MVHGWYSTAPICHGGGASFDPGAMLVSWFWSKKDDPQQTQQGPVWPTFFKHKRKASNYFSMFDARCQLFFAKREGRTYQRTQHVRATSECVTLATSEVYRTLLWGLLRKRFEAILKQPHPSWSVTGRHFLIYFRHFPFTYFLGKMRETRGKQPEKTERYIFLEASCHTLSVTVARVPAFEPGQRVIPTNPGGARRDQGFFRIFWAETLKGFGGWWHFINMYVRFII